MSYSEQIAIGSGKKVRIWAFVYNRSYGSIYFEVINGGWSGIIHPDGRITTSDKQRKYLGHGRVLWEGTAPHSDYNKAIEWIEEQIKSPWKYRFQRWIEFLRGLSRYRLKLVQKPRKVDASTFEILDISDEIPF